MMELHRPPASTRGLEAHAVALDRVRAGRPLLPELERFDRNLADRRRSWVHQVSSAGV